jgi:tryptophanyl-tRNA synthetase
MGVALTGIKPTGTPHLGNELGMIRPALQLAERYEAYYFIADYHALTTVKDGDEVRRLSYEVAATWLALGLDPERVTLYRQSDVPQVTELTWILSCVTPKGLLNRAHAYKAAVDENRDNDRDADAGVNMGLYNYPILMAADILFPGANVVPVGQDQRQHLEMTADMAEAFNAIYGPILTIPEAEIREEVMTIPGTDGRKMSKSYGNIIPIMAEPAELRKTVMRIVTDSRRPEEPKDPQEDTIYQIYRLVAPESAAAEMERGYREGGLGYGQAKTALYEALEERFRDVRTRYREILADLPAMDRIFAEGAQRVKERGCPILENARRATGMGPMR